MSIARQYVPLEVTTPKNTAVAAPLRTAAPVKNVVLNNVSVRIPPGHMGFTGLSVQWNGVSIVPFVQPVDYIVGNDDYFVFDVDEEIGGGLVVVTYNTDAVYSHTHYLRFNVTPFSLLSPPSSAATLVPIA